MCIFEILRYFYIFAHSRTINMKILNIFESILILKKLIQLVVGIGLNYNTNNVQKLVLSIKWTDIDCLINFVRRKIALYTIGNKNFGK